MRIRDVLIVAIGVLAALFGWLQEGSINIQRGFIAQITDSDSLIHVGVKPIVTDIDGDGKPELIATPARQYIAVYATNHVRRNYEDLFVTISPKATYPVASDIVGMAAGYLYHEHAESRPAFEKQEHEQQQGAFDGAEEASKKGEQPAADDAPRKQYIAVVTEDYRLNLYDSSFTLMWTISIVRASQNNMVLYHASVLVLPQRVFEQDHGCVVVAVKIAGANGTEKMLFAAYSGDAGELRWKHVVDSYDAVSASDAAATAFVGLNVSQRESLVNEAALQEHNNDLEWTNFREAVLSTMPHAYTHPWDVAMQPHIFFHHKNRKKVQPQEGVAGLAKPKYKDRKVKLDTDDVGELGERVGLAGAGKARPQDRHGKKNKKKKPNPPNVIVFHGKFGLEVIHLYTGKRVTRLAPLSPRNYYHDIDDDFHLDELTMQLGLHTETFGKHGVQTEIACKGVIYSGVPVARDPLYNATVCDTEGLLSSFSLLSHFLKGDSAEDAPQVDVLSMIGSRNIVSQKTHAVTPLVVQHHVPKGMGLFRLSRYGVFMIDSGLVTCLDPLQKTVVWRAETDAQFVTSHFAVAEEEEVSVGLHSEDEKDNRVKPFPHLARYSLHQHDRLVHSEKTHNRGTDPYVIAVGDSMMAAINSRSGQIAKQIALEQPPTGPLIIEDFNGDGTNDIIVVTAEGYYGYVVTQQASTSTIAMLMLLMVGLLAMLFVAREMRLAEEDSSMDLPTTTQPTVPRRVKRSTD